MLKVYTHWVGELKGDVNSPLDDTVRREPLWFPEEKPEGAKLLATEVFDEEVVFIRGIWTGKIRVGPIKAAIGVNVKFKGKIEYWVTGQDETG